MPKIVPMNFRLDETCLGPQTISDEVVKEQFKPSVEDEMRNVPPGEMKTFVYCGIFYVGYRLGRQHKQLNTEADIHLWEVGK